MNLNSGAAEALVYDSLKELGEEEKYKSLGQSGLCYVNCARSSCFTRWNISRCKIFICVYIRHYYTNRALIAAFA